METRLLLIKNRRSRAHCMYLYLNVVQTNVYSGNADFLSTTNEMKTVHKCRFLKRRCHFSKRLIVWPMEIQQVLPLKGGTLECVCPISID